jgi:hypothetical protein
MVNVGAVRIVWGISLIGAACLIGRLMLTGLYGRYPAFAAYLGVSLARTVLLTLLSPDSTTRKYHLAWVASEPIIMVLQLAMALEVYQRVSAHYPNLGRFGRHVLLWLTAVSAVACLVSLGPDLRATSWHFPVVQFMLLLKRVQVSILFGISLFSLAFYSFWWRAAKSPNVVRHAIISCAHFGVLSAYSFAVDVFYIQYWPATAIALTALLSCYVAWTLSLSRQGEIVTPRPTMSPARYQAAQAGWQALLEFSRAVNSGQKFS